MYRVRYQFYHPAWKRASEVVECHATLDDLRRRAHEQAWSIVECIQLGDDGVIAPPVPFEEGPMAVFSPPSPARPPLR